VLVVLLVAVAVLFWNRICHERRYGRSTTKSWRIFPLAGGLGPAGPCATRRTESARGQRQDRAAESSAMELVLSVQSDLLLKPTAGAVIGGGEE